MKLFLSLLLASISVPFLATAQSQSPPQTRIAVISDLNGPYGTLDYAWHVDSTVARVIREQPDIVIVAGDMIAGQDRRLPDDRFAQMWEVFYDRVGKPFQDAGIPFGFTIGNHDGSPSDPFTRERVAAREYWGNPAHDPLLDIVDKGDYPFYFSYRANDVFIITWDASSANITESTLSWVKEQLQSEEAQQASYRIMLGHLPLYGAAVGRNRYGEMLRNPDELHEVMQRYNVDMYVSGHHHAYYPGHKGGVDLLQTGALGGGPRPLLQFGADPRKSWSMLEISDKVTLTTWDADTHELIDNKELPRYLHGLTGFTVRRDTEIPSVMSSGWVTTAPVLNQTNSGVEARIAGDSISLVISIEPAIAKHFTSSEIMWKLHTYVAESEVSDTLFSGTIKPEISLSSYDKLDDFTHNKTLAVSDFDSDGLRGGIYYISLYDDGGQHVAMARLTPEPNMAPVAVALSSIEATVVSGDSVQVKWSRAIDPDGDGVFYTVRMRSGPDGKHVEPAKIVGPGTEAVLKLPSKGRSWYVEIIPNDQSLHGSPRGVWVR